MPIVLKALGSLHAVSAQVAVCPPARIAERRNFWGRLEALTGKEPGPSFQSNIILSANETVKGCEVCSAFSLC